MGLIRVRVKGLGPEEGKLQLCAMSTSSFFGISYVYLNYHLHK